MILDKTLERIISLIPKKENGDFKYGALKEFANSIGLKSGNLLSDWIAGRSVSYNSYVYEIAAKYNVSVEWLKGETDEKGIKKGPIQKDEADEMDAELVAIWNDSDETDRKLLLDMARAIKLRRENK